MPDFPRYHINVFWYPDDQCWIADVPDLRLCSAHGDTPEQAVAELRIAIGLWLETARAADQSIPEPRYSPALYAGR
ncbi:MAG: type II toxin-antitoxin system HicB family antitoxin [Novosphingobium sp.]